MGLDAVLFFSGMIVMADLVAALFFLKFWKHSRDRLFAYFTAAFLVLAIQRSVLTLGDHSDVVELMTYALRALAFIVIIIGIIDKNRRTA